MTRPSYPTAHRTSPEHTIHGFYTSYGPATDRLIELDTPHKHQSHAPYMRHIPTVQRLVEGLTAGEHVSHGLHVTYIPMADGSSIEGFGTPKHLHHRSYVRHIPSRQIGVEPSFIDKELIHIRHFSYFPHFDQTKLFIRCLLCVLVAPCTVYVLLDRWWCLLVTARASVGSPNIYHTEDAHEATSRTRLMVPETKRLHHHSVWVDDAWA